MEQDSNKQRSQRPKVDKEALKASKEAKKKALASNEIVHKNTTDEQNNNTGKPERS